MSGFNERHARRLRPSASFANPFAPPSASEVIRLAQWNSAPAAKCRACGEYEGAVPPAGTCFGVSALLRGARVPRCSACRRSISWFGVSLVVLLLARPKSDRRVTVGFCKPWVSGGSCGAGRGRRIGWLA